MGARPVYSSLRERLIANTAEPPWSGGCWQWIGKRDRWLYGRLNVYVPGLQAAVTVQAHIAMFVCFEALPRDADEFWLAYLELRHSGLELDHLCENEGCTHPEHIEPVTPSENCRRRDARRAALACAHV